MKTYHSTARNCLALMIGALILAFSSCRKSPETIGNNLISDNNYIDLFHTDTVEIVCHSYTDSVATKNASYALIGAIKDPVFGTTEAGFYTQLRPSVAGQSFGSNPVLDSLVLQLFIADYYGDTMGIQTLHAYVLIDSLSYEGKYYSNSVLATEVIDQANNYQFMPRPRTKTNVIGTDTVGQPVLRIPLSQELGNFLLNLDSTYYSRPDLFKEQFKGLHIECSPVSQNGSILSINLTNNAFTMLQLYYHNAATPEKPMRYNYYVTSSDTYFNHYEHDYHQGSPEFVQQVLDSDEGMGQERIYLQTMGGVKTFIRFPHLANWCNSMVNSHLVVNEAKLILPATQLLLDSVYKAPSMLALTGFNVDSTTYLLPDYYEGATYFGGSYDAKHNTVTFRISEYLQDMVSRQRDNFGLSLGINGAAYNAQRLVINGPKALDGEKMRLEVTYSIVKE